MAAVKVRLVAKNHKLLGTADVELTQDNELPIVITIAGAGMQNGRTFVRVKETDSSYLETTFDWAKNFREA